MSHNLESGKVAANIGSESERNFVEFYDETHLNKVRNKAPGIWMAWKKLQKFRQDYVREYPSDPVEQLIRAAVEGLSECIRNENYTQEQLIELAATILHSRAARLFRENSRRNDEIKKKSNNAKKAAEASHEEHRKKQHLIRQHWASGKYSSRDECAEIAGAALGMRFSTARRALRNTPDPI